MSYSIHSILFSPIWSYSVYSVLYSPLWSYLVFIGPILSTSDYSGHTVSIRSILSTLVVFGPFCSLWFNLVLFRPFYPLWSTLVLFRPFGPFCPLWFYFVHFVHFRPIQFILVLLCSLWSILSTSVQVSPPTVLFSPFVPILFIWSTLFYLF